METAFREELIAFQSTSSKVASVQSFGMNLSRFLESSMMCWHSRGAVAAVVREVNPYRSELQGIHMVLTTIYAICKFHDVSSGKVTVYCDNKKALWLSSQHSPQVSLTQKHIDLI